MNRKTENPLTDHLREVLHDHEEAYVLGSWERFQRKQKRVRNRKIIYSSAAAVLILFTFAWAWTSLEKIPSGQFAEERPGIIQPDTTGNEQDQPIAGTGQLSVPEPLENVHPVEQSTTESAQFAGIPEQRYTSAIPSANKKLPFYSVSGKSSVHIPVPGRAHINNIKEPGLPNEVNYRNDSEFTGPFVKEEDIRKHSKKDVEFSVAYASVMNFHESQTDLGMGGGFYTDWNFTEKLTATSGLFISQNRLKYDIEPENQLMMDEETGEDPSVLNADDLAFIQLDLVNLEVPLSLRYAISNNVSFSAGLTSVAFLKEEYDYTYEYEQPIQVFSTNETKESELVTRVVTLTSSQTEAEPSLNSINWAAFYTFSMGYKWDIMNRHQVMFEPFVKIPARQITTRDIRYTAGGIQLKISF